MLLTFALLITVPLALSPIRTHMPLRHIAAICLTVCALAAAAQEAPRNFAIDAQLRTRAEYDNGVYTPRAKHESAVIGAGERTRLSLDYRQDRMQLHAAAQHTGMWGQGGLDGTAEQVTLSEAWARIAMGRHAFVQVGRQVLSYDDERLLGASDWSQTGASHDALRVGYEGGATRVHAILAQNRSREHTRMAYYAGAMPYKSMQALWLHHAFGSLPLHASLMAINLGREGGSVLAPHTRYMQTWGTHLGYNSTDWDAHLAAYVQTGRNTLNVSTNAFMVSAGGTYRLNATTSLRASYDYMSGNDGRNINEHAFDPLYGTSHRFFGAMDYFRGRVECGLQDVHIGTTATVHRLTPEWQLALPVSVSLDYHYILAAESYAGISRGLGHEIDLQFSCSPATDITISGGYSTMLGLRSLDAVCGGSHTSWQDWAWLQLNISPRLFFTQW